MRYYSANEYFKSIFKEKTYKISLDGNMSCPTRDKNGNGGCIFCSRGGSGEFSIKKSTDIKSQIDEAIKLVKSKKATKYIAYYQSYTNTYQSIDYLRKLFFETIEDDRVVAISIATRPDCISEECISLLKELNAKKKVFVELGLQSASDDTARVLRRGYFTKTYTEISKRLRDEDINVITHLIIGLPGESESNLLDSINFINDKTDGVKLHLLYVLKDTELEKMYNEGKNIPLSMDEYMRLLSKAILHLNPKIVVHRLTGDPPKRLLVAPDYSVDKKRVINAISKYFNENDIIQGQLFKE